MAKEVVVAGVIAQPVKEERKTNNCGIIEGGNGIDLKERCGMKKGPVWCF